MERNLSKNKLAELSGVDRAYITLIEQGKRVRISAETRDKLAKALGVASDYFSEEPEDRSLEKVLREALTLAQGLNGLVAYRIPIIAEGSAGDRLMDTESDTGEYRYWSGSQEMLPYIKGIRVVGTCLTPRVCPGDILFANTQLSPVDGDIVVCLLDGNIAIKQYRERNGDRWVECNEGRVSFETCHIKAVVIERSESMRRNHRESV